VDEGEVMALDLEGALGGAQDLDLARAVDLDPDRRVPRADMTQQRTDNQAASQLALSPLERGHRQAGVVELLPIQLGRLLVPTPDDRLSAVVDLVGDRVAAVDGDAGNVAGERVSHVVERVVVVIADDDAPRAAQTRAGILRAWKLDDLSHGL
jgi:hypothetical protein